MLTLANPFYETRLGQAYNGDALDLISSLPDQSVNLVLTSPPFALTRKKEYGNESAAKYVEWFLPFARQFRRILADDGSFVLDLGGAYLPGVPVRSIYQYELLVALVKEVGFYLAQEFFHYNPSRLPAPAEWVTVRRIRVKDAVNVVWWLSVSPYPKADNRRVLKEYSEAMLTLLRNGYKPKLRPSGHDISPKFRRTHGGAIPPNVLNLPLDAPANIIPLANTESNSKYLRRCKEVGVKPHPARFPLAFADFFIKMTTDVGDTVLDPFAGSNATGAAAEALERKWIAFELSEAYVRGSMLRFDLAPAEPVLPFPDDKA